MQKAIVLLDIEEKDHALPSHEMRNEVVEELSLIGGTKVVQNRTPSP